MTWKDVTLFQFQQIEAINAREDIDDLDKLLFATCVLFGMTEYELDQLGGKYPRKAAKLISKTKKVFESKVVPVLEETIGMLTIEYDPSRMTFGQYIEVAYFNSRSKNTIDNAHYLLASISRKLFRKHSAADHRQKADFFLQQPIEVVAGSLAHFQERLQAFNNEYKGLFGLDKEVYTSSQIADQFNKRYGWIYSASQVAEYERIPLQEAFGIPVRQALNDLAYLKAKAKYDAELLKAK